VLITTWLHPQIESIGVALVTANYILLYVHQTAWLIGLCSVQMVLIFFLLRSQARRRKAEHSVARNYKIHKMVAEISASLLGDPESLVNGKLRETFQRLFQEFGFQRACLIELDEDDTQGALLYWLTEDRAVVTNIDPQQSVWLRERLLHYQAVVLSRLKDLSAEKEVFERYAPGLANGRLAVLPLRADGDLLGAVALAPVKSRMTWPSEGTSELQTVADIFTNTLKRRKAALELKESEERFRRLADSAPVMMWMLGPDKLCAYVNEGWLAFTGRELQQELGRGWIENVHPDDSQRFMQTYSTAFESHLQFTIEYRLRRGDGLYRWVVSFGAPRFLMDNTFAGYIGCCFDITDRKELEKARTEFGGRLIAAQEEERTRIARELHDDIGQRLALLAIDIQQFERSAAVSDAEVLEKIRRLWEQTNEISADLGRISHQLHSSKLQLLGLAPAIHSLCEEFSRQHGITVNCNTMSVPDRLNSNISLGLFRVVQEALRNAVKHSHAKSVTVRLSMDKNEVFLSIFDDGVGFELDAALHGKGLGLISMEERLRLLGGRLFIWSKPSSGTRIEARVSLASEPRQIRAGTQMRGKVA
jgi:PAS domain S-box-containing protein